MLHMDSWLYSKFPPLWGLKNASLSHRYLWMLLPSVSPALDILTFSTPSNSQNHTKFPHSFQVEDTDAVAGTCTQRGQRKSFAHIFPSALLHVPWGLCFAWHYIEFSHTLQHVPPPDSDCTVWKKNMRNQLSIILQRVFWRFYSNICETDYVVKASKEVWIITL